MFMARPYLLVLISMVANIKEVSWLQGLPVCIQGARALFRARSSRLSSEAILERDSSWAIEKKPSAGYATGPGIESRLQVLKKLLYNNL